MYFAEKHHLLTNVWEQRNLLSIAYTIVLRAFISLLTTHKFPIKELISQFNQKCDIFGKTQREDCFCLKKLKKKIKKNVFFFRTDRAAQLLLIKLHKFTSDVTKKIINQNFALNFCFSSKKGPFRCKMLEKSFFFKLL